MNQSILGMRISIRVTTTILSNNMYCNSPLCSRFSKFLKRHRNTFSRLKHDLTVTPPVSRFSIISIPCGPDRFSRALNFPVRTQTIAPDHGRAGQFFAFWPPRIPVASCDFLRTFLANGSITSGIVIMVRFVWLNIPITLVASFNLPPPLGSFRHFS